MADRLVVVDGYNVILRSPALRPGEGRTLRESRDKLLNLLAWVTDAHVQFIVVFDGAAVRGHDARQGRVQVRYSKPPAKADELIREIVEDRVDRTDRVTVVTADLEVARHARAVGAEPLLGDLFLASVMPPSEGGDPEKPVALSKKEIEEWAEIFRRRSAAPPPGDEAGGE
jgi:predicted RNA-binding protein with PIN domain